MWICSAVISNAECQDTSEQHELNQKQRPRQRWTTFPGYFGDAPDYGNGDKEDGNRKNLGRVDRTATCQHRRNDDEVAGDVCGKELETQKPHHIHRASNSSEQRRKGLIQ